MPSHGYFCSTNDLCRDELHLHVIHQFHSEKQLSALIFHSKTEEVGFSVYLKKRELKKNACASSIFIGSREIRHQART